MRGKRYPASARTSSAPTNAMPLTPPPSMTRSARSGSGAMVRAYCERDGPEAQRDAGRGRRQTGRCPIPLREESVMKIARRIDDLGTETAFAVAQAAADWSSRGHTVYPFHLGDIDLPTAPHIVEAMNAAIADGKTGYCPGPGIPELRDALAEDIGGRRGMRIPTDHVVVTTGGKPVITKFLQTVMDPGDEVLYPNPGFPIYESQIEYLGGVPLPYRYVPTSDGFAIDLDHLRSLITPRTTALIYNDLQNPISAESTDEEREA